MRMDFGHENALDKFWESAGNTAEEKAKKGEKEQSLMHSNKLLLFISSQAHQSSLFR